MPSPPAAERGSQLGEREGRRQLDACGALVAAVELQADNILGRRQGVGAWLGLGSGLGLGLGLG